MPGGKAFSAPDALVTLRFGGFFLSLRGVVSQGGGGSRLAIVFDVQVAFAAPVVQRVVTPGSFVSPGGVFAFTHAPGGDCADSHHQGECDACEDLQTAHDPECDDASPKREAAGKDRRRPRLPRGRKSPVCYYEDAMTTSARTRPQEATGDRGPAGLPAPGDTLFRFRQAISGGQHWFEAVLDAVGQWRLPEERVGDRTYRYLTGGEAFDWLLLAERLLEEVRDITPAADCDALLFDGRWPDDLEIGDEEFAARIGAAKHAAHLNYLYGVLVEESLQLSVEEEIHKQSRARAWGMDPRDDESMYVRVYGRGRGELTAMYYEQTGRMLGEHVPYADWKEWTYWLFKTRLKRQDKARVASDTRKGLAQLTRMELAVSERRRGTSLNEAGFAARFPTD